MSPEMVAVFYSGGPREKMQILPPEYPQRYHSPQSRWDEWSAYMTSGPVTFAPLFSPDNQAVEHWRIQMEKDWNVERLRISSPDSLRCLARDSDKNLLHGSDSPQSAQKEIGLLADFLEQLPQAR